MQKTSAHPARPTPAPHTWKHSKPTSLHPSLTSSHNQPCSLPPGQPQCQLLLRGLASEARGVAVLNCRESMVGGCPGPSGRSEHVAPACFRLSTSLSPTDSNKGAAPVILWLDRRPRDYRLCSGCGWASFLLEASSLAWVLGPGGKNEQPSQNAVCDHNAQSFCLLDLCCLTCWAGGS